MSFITNYQRHLIQFLTTWALFLFLAPSAVANGGCPSRWCTSDLGISGTEVGRRLYIDDLKLNGFIIHSQKSELTAGDTALLSGNYKTAYREYKALADAGDEFAAHNVGMLNYFGRGTPENLSEAFKYLKISLKNPSNYSLAYSYIVRSAQKRLKILGLYDGGADGIVGEETWRAVRRFHEINGKSIGINPDQDGRGYIGGTIDALANILTTDSASPPSTTPTSQLTSGNSDQQQASGQLATGSNAENASDENKPKESQNYLLFILTGAFIALAIFARRRILDCRNNAEDDHFSEPSDGAREKAQSSNSDHHEPKQDQPKGERQRFENDWREQTDDEQSKNKQDSKFSDDDRFWWAAVLKVPPDATLEEITKAYKVLISKYHPDKVASLGEELRDVAEQMSKKINEAYRAAKLFHGN